LATAIPGLCRDDRASGRLHQPSPPLRPPQRGARNHTLLARRRECRLRASRPRRHRTQRRGNWIRIIL